MSDTENSALKTLKNGINRLKRAFFPLNLTCNNCGKEIFSGGNFCEDCEKHLYKNDKFICEKCGRKVPVAMSRCIACKGEWQVDIARSCYLYDGVAKNLILSYKYYSKRYIAQIFAPEIVAIYLKENFHCDVVMGVPTSRDTLFERGFNQSEYLAKEVAKLLNIRYIAPLIKKNITSEQAGLGAKSRRKNIKSSFKMVDGSLVKGKKVLIIDDVLTTGATSGEVARLLKVAKADKVFLITVASTVHET